MVKVKEEGIESLEDLYGGESVQGEVERAANF